MLKKKKLIEKLPFNEKKKKKIVRLDKKIRSKEKLHLCVSENETYFSSGFCLVAGKLYEFFMEQM
jgi:hypothetical protein